MEFTLVDANKIFYRSLYVRPCVLSTMKQKFHFYKSVTLVWYIAFWTAKSKLIYS